WGSRHQIRSAALPWHSMGPHALGADFDANEHAMLKRIAQNAAAVYAELENNDLRHKISILERKLSANGSARAKRCKRGE
ncbi:MAG TPA: hypothetical protein VIQ39_08080, partial [Methyloceanibacter sp.]